MFASTGYTNSREKSSHNFRRIGYNVFAIQSLISQKCLVPFTRLFVKKAFRQIDENFDPILFHTRLIFTRVRGYGQRSTLRHCLIACESFHKFVICCFSFYISTFIKTGLISRTIFENMWLFAFELRMSLSQTTRSTRSWIWGCFWWREYPNTRYPLQPGYLSPQSVVFLLILSISALISKHSNYLPGN